MLLSLTTTLFQTLLVVLMLSAVLLLLAGMNILFSRHGDECAREARLKRDLKKRKDVISSESVFHDFLVGESKVVKQRPQQKRK